MATKYIVNNLSGQTINGGLKISGDAYVVTTPPSSITGSTGDVVGKLAFDSNYLYYCDKDFVGVDPVVISGGTPTHVYDAEPSTSWNGYGDNYLQVGPSQEGDVSPQNGWYMVDDLGVIRQIIGGFWLSPAAPYPNGTGWIMTLDGPFTYNVSNPTITLYETLPVVTGGGLSSGNIWKTVKLDKELNTTGVYRALLTQTGSITGTDISSFGYSLIIGETYTIDSYNSDDDFSNVADVQSGTINETGCVFIATSEIPKNWSNGSNLISGGDLIVNELENSLGFPLQWDYNGPIPPGVYVGYNALLGPTNNTFPKKDTYITSQRSSSFVSNPLIVVNNICQVGNFINSNDVVFFAAIDYDYGGTVNDTLYYTPVEVRLKKDLSIVEIQCTSIPNFDFNYVSFSLFCNDVEIDSYYTDDDTLVSNISELVTILNNNPNTNTLGTFSEDGTGGIILSMTNYNKNIICPNNGILTFTVFQD